MRLSKEEIIARKNALRAMGKNVVVDESWGPNLERMWQSVAPGRYMVDTIQGGDTQDNNNASWYNPLTWTGGIAKGLTNDMTREERQRYLDSHPILRNWYLDDDRYGDGKSFANGIETLGNIAATSFPVGNINKAGKWFNVFKKFVPKFLRSGKRAAKNAVKSNWKLFKGMPMEYTLNAMLNYGVTPLASGLAVNTGTKAATDALTGGHGLDFDQLAGQATGTNEFVGGMFNPGYSFRALSPDMKKLWKATNVPDKVFDLFYSRAGKPPRKWKVESVRSLSHPEVMDPASVRMATKDALSKLNDSKYPVRVGSASDRQSFIVEDFSGRGIEHGVAQSPFSDAKSQFRQNSRTKTVLDSRLIDWMYGDGSLTSNIRNRFDLKDVAKEHVFNSSPVFDNSWQPITDDYKRFASSIESTIGDDGLLSGSVRQFADGWFPGTYDGQKIIPAHDLEFVTTSSRLKSLSKKLDIEDLQNGSVDFVKTGYSRKFPQLSNGSTDIQVIQEKKGKATGQLAHEIYSYLHPDEYAKWHNEFTIKHRKGYGDTPLTDERLPISAEQLYQELRNSGLNGERVVADVLGSHKHKHIDRARVLLTNPDKLHAAQSAYKRKMESVIEGYKDPLSVYTNFDFDNIDSNKKIIQFATGVDDQTASELANNKEYVQDLFRWIVDNRSIGFRRTSVPEGKDQNVIDGLLKGAAGYGHGQARGPGLNFMRLRQAENYYGPYSSVTQNMLTYHPEKILTWDDMFEQIQSLGKKDNELFKKPGIPFNKEHERISALSVDRDQPIYLGNNGFLGALHDKEVPHGLYVNADAIEVPGVNVIERSLDQTPFGPIMTYDEIKKYLMSMRERTAKNSNIKELVSVFPHLSGTNTDIPFFINFNKVYKKNKGLHRLASKDEFKSLIDKLDKMTIEEASNLTDREIMLADKLNDLYYREHWGDLTQEQVDRLANSYRDILAYPYELWKPANWNTGFEFGPSVPYSAIKSNVGEQQEE